MLNSLFLLSSYYLLIVVLLLTFFMLSDCDRKFSDFIMCFVGDLEYYPFALSFCVSRRLTQIDHKKKKIKEYQIINK